MLLLLIVFLATHSHQCLVNWSFFLSSFHVSILRKMFLIFKLCFVVVVVFGLVYTRIFVSLPISISHLFLGEDSYISLFHALLLVDDGSF